MNEWIWIAMVGAAFGAGRWWGGAELRRFLAALAAGVSPKARAVRDVLLNDSLSTENDR